MEDEEVDATLWEIIGVLSHILPTVVHLAVVLRYSSGRKSPTVISHDEHGTSSLFKNVENDKLHGED